MNTTAKALTRWTVIAGVVIVALVGVIVVQAVAASSEYWAGTATTGRLTAGFSGNETGRLLVGFGSYAVAPTVTPPSDYLFPPSTATSNFGSGYLLHILIAMMVVLGTSFGMSALMRVLGSGSLLIKTAVMLGAMGIFVALPNVSGVPASGTWLDFWMIIFFVMMSVALMMGSKQVSWG